MPFAARLIDVEIIILSGVRDYHTKWSKPDRETEVYDIACMWNLNK